jgi:hypothetical protein
MSLQLFLGSLLLFCHATISSAKAFAVQVGEGVVKVNKQHGMIIIIVRMVFQRSVQRSKAVSVAVK